MHVPFKYVVGSDAEDSLSTIALKHGACVTDLKQWNPSLSMPAAPSTAASKWYTSVDILPQGTIVQLPPSLCMQGRTFGESFRPKEFSRQLQESLSRARAACADVAPSCEFVRPSRRIQSKEERSKRAVAETALADAVGVIERTGVNPSGPVLTVEMPTQESQRAMEHMSSGEGSSSSSLRDNKKRIETCFNGMKLECLHPDNQELFQSNEPGIKRNLLSDSRVQTVPDNTSTSTTSSSSTSTRINTDTDIQLSFAFLEPRSVCVVREVWSVLSPQGIGALIDAIHQCKNTNLPYPYTENRLFFIGGTFYVDDRHEGWEDASETIRGWLPSTVDQSLGEAGKPFAPCPVRRVSQTTFADLSLRMNEICLFRHLGTCDHLFYLIDVRKPGSGPDEPTCLSQYPRRTFHAGERSINCDVCAKLPATIATYGDALCPHNPTVFCKPCFLIAHCDENGVELNAEEHGYIKYELPPGKYF